MAYPTGAIPLTGSIGTTDVTDTFATHQDYLGHGGHTAIASTTARNAITADRRAFGMTVTLQDSNPVQTYVLANIAMGGASNTLTDNSNWILEGSGAVSGTGTINQATYWTGTSAIGSTPILVFDTATIKATIASGTNNFVTGGTGFDFTATSGSHFIANIDGNISLSSANNGATINASSGNGANFYLDGSSTINSQNNPITIFSYGSNGAVYLSNDNAGNGFNLNANGSIDISATGSDSDLTIKHFNKNNYVILGVDGAINIRSEDGQFTNIVATRISFNSPASGDGTYISPGNYGEGLYSQNGDQAIATIDAGNRLYYYGNARIIVDESNNYIYMNSNGEGDTTNFPGFKWSQDYYGGEQGLYNLANDGSGDILGELFSYSAGTSSYIFAHRCLVANYGQFGPETAAFFMKGAIQLTNPSVPTQPGTLLGVNFDGNEGSGLYGAADSSRMAVYDTNTGVYYYGGNALSVTVDTLNTSASNYPMGLLHLDGNSRIAYLGDWDGMNNGTKITIDDDAGFIALQGNAEIIGSAIVGGDLSVQGNITDENDATILALANVSGAVDYFQINNIQSGQELTLSAQGSSTNIGMYFATKGNGEFRFKATSVSPTAFTMYEQTTNGNDAVIFTAPTSITGTRNIALPDASGTVALTSDVTGTTYTPTLTGVTNVTSSTAKVSQYTRVGNVATVYGSLDIVTTLAVATEVDISLPVASNFAAATNANGIANASSAIATNAYIDADATNDRVRLKFIGLAVGGSGTLFYTFSYSVI